MDHIPAPFPLYVLQSLHPLPPFATAEERFLLAGIPLALGSTASHLVYLYWCHAVFSSGEYAHLYYLVQVPCLCCGTLLLAVLRFFNDELCCCCWLLCCCFG